MRRLTIPRGFPPGREPGSRAVLIALLATTVFLRASSGQEREPVPSFPSQAAAILVDAVVRGSDGHPVRDLTPADFTILEDGRPQPIVGFEYREMAPPPAEEAEDLARPGGVATNSSPRRGRVLALLVDDLGLAPPSAQQVRPALERWLREKADPADEVTITTTSGDLFWTDRLDSGREDLLAVLGRMIPKKAAPSASGPTMSDQEAYEIAVNDPTGAVGDDDVSRVGSSAPTPSPGQGAARPLVSRSTSVLDRVANRWVDAGLCCYCDGHTCLDCGPPLRQCKSRVRMAATEIYDATRRRHQTLLDALGHLTRELSGIRGRKSILIVSESLPRDALLDQDLSRVTEAAQRTNTSIYFTSAQGLLGASFNAAEVREAARPGDLGALVTESTILAMAGAEQLAQATGGVAITTSNDLASGLDRMAADAAAYYLLGYQPARPPDSRWHKLEVKVARKGVTVRARRGYLAGPDATAAVVADSKVQAPARKSGKEKEGGRPRELLAGDDLDAIPVRLATYVQGPGGPGSVRVLVVLELDSRRLRVDKTTGTDRASLDLEMVGVLRDRMKVIPRREVLDLTLGAGDAGGWWALFREISLPPGVAQVRARVRDRATGAAGTVSQRLEVPNAEEPYLSTPLLSDKTQPPLAPGEPPRLVPSAHRVFPRAGRLFCQYELFSFGGQTLPGVPQVLGSYTLQAPDGHVMVMAPPTPIRSDGQRVVRRLAFDLDRLEPGPYELLVTVEDHLARRTLRARESFVVEALAAPPSPGETPATPDGSEPAPGPVGALTARPRAVRPTGSRARARPR